MSSSSSSSVGPSRLLSQLTSTSPSSSTDPLHNPYHSSLGQTLSPLLSPSKTLPDNLITSIISSPSFFLTFSTSFNPNNTILKTLIINLSTEKVDIQGFNNLLKRYYSLVDIEEFYDLIKILPDNLKSYALNLPPPSLLFPLHLSSLSKTLKGALGSRSLESLMFERLLFYRSLREKNVKVVYDLIIEFILESGFECAEIIDDLKNSPFSSFLSNEDCVKLSLDTSYNFVEFITHLPNDVNICDLILKQTNEENIKKLISLTTDTYEYEGLITILYTSATPKVKIELDKNIKPVKPESNVSALNYVYVLLLTSPLEPVNEVLKGYPNIAPHLYTLLIYFLNNSKDKNVYLNILCGLDDNLINSKSYKMLLGLINSENIKSLNVGLRYLHVLAVTNKRYYGKLIEHLNNVVNSRLNKIREPNEIDEVVLQVSLIILNTVNKDPRLIISSDLAPLIQILLFRDDIKNKSVRILIDALTALVRVEGMDYKGVFKVLKKKTGSWKDVEGREDSVIGFLRLPSSGDTGGEEKSLGVLMEFLEEGRFLSLVYDCLACYNPEDYEYDIEEEEEIKGFIKRDVEVEGVEKLVKTIVKYEQEGTRDVMLKENSLGKWLLLREWKDERILYEVCCVVRLKKEWEEKCRFFFGEKFERVKKCQEGFRGSEWK
ncbi:hypothetical protein TL16_g01714 [Triparma laevis f. inornata]|uniref:Uncharacterized protein n=1 Tax=Triparma laevis f. inornata TaxID=1714386 RepID=A0A9W6ZQJ4_9STRA|nr:hypothetical protein TL16_g01714 [Triparma laevis f. inornata]